MPKHYSKRPPPPREDDDEEMSWVDVSLYACAALVVVAFFSLFLFAWVKLGVTQELIDFLRQFVSVEIGAQL